MTFRSDCRTSEGGQPERLVLVRRGFWRSSGGTTSTCSRCEGCCCDQVMASLTEGWPQDVSAFGGGHDGRAGHCESQESESDADDEAETEESSEACEEASDHTEADEAEATVAREEE